MRRSRRWRERAGVLVALCAVAVMLLPVAYMAIMSVRAPADVAAAPLGLPRHLDFGGYRVVLRGISFVRNVANTLGITLSVIAIVALVSSLAAYPLARVPGRFSHALYLLLTLGLTIPLFIGLTPLYLLLRDLRLLGTYPGIVLAYAGLHIPLGAFFTTSFLRGLPRELEEAAAIDGCGWLGAYWHVILPLLRPVIATLALFITLGVWNDLLYPLLFLPDESKQTITVAVFRFLGSHNIDPTQLFPAAVLATLPLIALFLVLQRRIVAGITAGAVKG